MSPLLQPLSRVSRALDRVADGQRGMRMPRTGLAELDELAAGRREVAALGWRRDAFGKDAERLCDGKLALRANGSSVDVFEI